MVALMVAAVLALPAVYELDFRDLPAANTAPYYEYTIILSFPGEPDVKILTGIGMKKSPADAADSFVEALNDPRWKFKRNGERITVYGYDDVRIQNLKVEGRGPQPLVRWVPGFPSEKKK